jgi:hypothetical protein
MADTFNESINTPAGHLAEIILKKMIKGTDANELPDDMGTRLDRLVDAPGRPGKLARIRLAAEVSYLFERAPKWTKAKILPLFEWSCAEASDAWSSRKYSNYIGSPELFGLLKRPFLEMFGRTDVPSDDLRTFTDWLTLILMANKAGNSYFLTPSEARSAVRRAGAEVLSSVAHRLAIEMEAAKTGEKRELWRTVVAPVFQEIWPLDVELQSRASTFKLVQILIATGDVFHEAADVFIPFIRPDDSPYQISIFSIAEAPEALYASSPGKMLELVSAVVGDAPPGSVRGLSKALSRIRAIEPGLANTRKFQKLLGYASA